MKKILFLILIFPFILMSCNGQTEANRTKKGNENSRVASDLKNQPHVSIKVNKQYDENGNLIAEDSSYVWTYSNVQGDSLTIPADSVWTRFQPFFNENFPSLFRQHFNNRMKNDSTFIPEFFNDDFFFHQWKNDFFDMNKMFHRMDSLKNEFFNQNFPEVPGKK